MLCAGLAGPAGPAQIRAADDSQTIVVFAAASTTNAIGEIKRQFTAISGVQVQAGYGSSAALAQQIVNGATADVFLSADGAWADYLAKQGLVAQRQNLLGNRLVIVVPDDSTLRVHKPEDLLADGIQHLALGNPESVPAGKSAKQALKKLGLWERLRPKVAAAEDVRSALAYVETGAAEAGIVYATDAAISKKVKVAATISPELSGPIRYPVVLLKQAAGRPAAESFYQFLRGPESQKIFQNYGFTLLPETERPLRTGS
jgi:molybdate transport system substrate-binding protein